MSHIRNFFTILHIRFCGRKSKLQAAIKQANSLHSKTGKRYRVFFFGNKYHVWTRDDIKERKKSSLFKRHLKAGEDFDKICFYDTSNPDNNVSK